MTYVRPTQGVVIFTAPCPTCGADCTWTAQRSGAFTDRSVPGPCRCYVPGLVRLRAVSDAIAAAKAAVSGERS